MSNIKFWDVYDGGRATHYTSEQLFVYLELLPTGTVIDDRAAQTIASWWANNDCPHTTRLSTMGIVDRYASIGCFGDAMDCETEDDKRALCALAGYITHKQQTAPSGARPCACDDCMDTAYGTAGELCEACAEAFCDAMCHASCERADAHTDCD